MGILFDFLRWLPAYFFPKICYGCGKEGSFVCRKCRPSVPCLLDAPLTFHKKDTELDLLVSYYKYHGWAAKIIKAAKFGDQPCFGALEELSKEFAEELPNNSFDKKAVLVPIPLHWWRKRRRGYNQAELIARQLSNVLNMPVENRLLKRKTYTEPQTLQEKTHQRTKNVRGAFLVNKGATIPTSVILVDDVWTTGATMQECCRVLKLAGVKTVWGITLLKA